MAITYTYSFNCTIKYRLSSEAADTSTPAFDDSIILYSCTAETTNVESIKVPLPDYLQGADTGIQWYLSSEYNDSEKVSSGKELTASQWTLTNKVKLGTFTSCDAEIILYTNSAPRTLIWKYDKEDATEEGVTTVDETTTTWQPIPKSTSENYVIEYANFINLHAPKIPAWVSSKNGSNSTLYVFTGWKDPVKTADIEEYTIEADYSKTTYDETNPYTLKSANPFADAEPYHYGVGTPPEGYFIPIGADDDPTTDEIKVQAAEKNGYSIIKKLDSFNIKNYPIQYIEKGTFPLPRILVSHTSEYTAESEASSDGCFCQLTINYTQEDAKNVISKIELHKYTVGIGFKLSDPGESALIFLKNHDGYCDDDKEISRSNDNYKIHGHANKYPKRLGFILTGGGGGAGGVSRIDPKSDGKDNDYTTPGGGGGGGEILCGVFNIEPDGMETKKAFMIYLGNGGAGGDHGKGNPDYDSPKYGKDGKDGKDSIIWKVNFDSAGKAESLSELCCAGGGKGGKRSTGGAGGNGGDGGNTADKYALGVDYDGVVLCHRFVGGRGGEPVDGTTAQNEALETMLYFSTAVPSKNSQNENKFYIYHNYPALSGSHNPDDLSLNSNIPGGHSFGRGATAEENPSRGAGGCCNKSGGRDGAGAYFGLYY